MEWMPWTSGKQRITQELNWSRTLLWRQVAKLFGDAWGTGWPSWSKRLVAYGLAQRNLSEFTRVGIDKA